MIIEEPDDLCLGCMSINDTGGVCPYCGFDNNAQQPSPQALPLRTILHKKFLIGRILGKGGFGITYLAWDLVLQTPVAIKEFLPFSLVAREPNRTTVIAHTPDNKTAFEYGLKQFLLEARTLAQFSHANVVRVREFFPANNTAYLVMDYYKGASLQKFLQQRGEKLPEQQALQIILPILDGLAQVHKKGFLHRDIKPDNIYLSNYEHPVLLDFGAARNAFGQKSQSMSVILTPGFAPFEQYLSRSTFTASTDIYAVAATLYYMVSGVKPHEATARLKNDPVLNLAHLEPSLSQDFSKTVMQGLALFPEQRPQTVEEFQKRLVATPQAENRAIAPPLSSAQFQTVPGYKQPLSTLTLMPVGQAPASQRTRKRDAYTCPHCQTKNMIPEGKRYAEVTCVKCRKSPLEPLQAPEQSIRPGIFIKIGLLLLLMLLGYRFISQRLSHAETFNALTTPLLDQNAAETTAPAQSPGDQARLQTHEDEAPPTDAPIAESPKQQAAAPPQGGGALSRTYENARPSAGANIAESPQKRMATQNIEPPRRQSREPPPPPLEFSERERPRQPPQFALDACIGKSRHDECVANTPRRPLTGVCENVEGVLACIPGELGETR